MAAVASLDGQPAVVDGGAPGGHAVEAGQILSQTDVQRIIGTFYDADVRITTDLSGTALDLQGIAQTYGHILTIIALEDPAAVRLVAYGLQLIFRSGTSTLDVFSIPFSIVQAI